MASPSEIQGIHDYGFRRDYNNEMSYISDRLHVNSNAYKSSSTTHFIFAVTEEKNSCSSSVACTQPVMYASKREIPFRELSKASEVGKVVKGCVDDAQRSVSREAMDCIRTLGCGQEREKSVSRKKK